MIKVPRPTTDHDRLALKAATRQALALAGGVSRFELATRVAAPALSKYGAVQEIAAFMPLDVAADLDRDLGAPVMAEAMAALAGYRLTPADAVAPGAPSLADVAKIMRESCDVADALTAALADGKIGPAEARTIDREIEEAIAVLRGLQGRVRMSGGAP